MTAEIHNRLAQFRAVYCSGAFILDADAIVALSLLFEKIFLPCNLEMVRSFVSKYRLVSPVGAKNGSIIVEPADDSWDTFADLLPSQRESAMHYLGWAFRFAVMHSQLLGEVFESELYPDKPIFRAEKVTKAPGGLYNYDATASGTLILKTFDDGTFSKLIEDGYVPVVGRYHDASPLSVRPDEQTAKQLATLVAMKSIQMVLPRTRSASAEVILEMRYRLRDQLPPFWSSMFKVSVELRKVIADSRTHYDVALEATDLVDRTIRPAAIDLAAKLEKERKDWFYRVLSPVRSGLRLLVGNPPLTQQQLLTSALVLAADTCVSIADNMHVIESLKREAGLTYLLDLSEMFNSGLDGAPTAG